MQPLTATPPDKTNKDKHLLIPNLNHKGRMKSRIKEALRYRSRLLNHKGQMESRTKEALRHRSRLPKIVTNATATQTKAR